MNISECVYTLTLGFEWHQWPVFLELSELRLVFQWQLFHLEAPARISGNVIRVRAYILADFLASDG